MPYRSQTQEAPQPASLQQRPTLSVNFLRPEVSQFRRQHLNHIFNFAARNPLSQQFKYTPNQALNVKTNSRAFWGLDRFKVLTDMAQKLVF